LLQTLSTWSSDLSLIPNADFWVLENSLMKMNSASILLNGGMVDYGFFKIIIASENGYEPRAFPQEGII
jgi:hypothetical protein